MATSQHWWGQSFKVAYEPVSSLIDIHDRSPLKITTLVWDGEEDEKGA